MNFTDSTTAQCAKKKDGGAATDGVSRAAFNKICLEYFVSAAAVVQLPFSLPCRVLEGKGLIWHGFCRKRE